MKNLKNLWMQLNKRIHYSVYSHLKPPAVWQYFLCLQHADIEATVMPNALNTSLMQSQFLINLPFLSYWVTLIEEQWSIPNLFLLGQGTKWFLEACSKFSFKVHHSRLPYEIVSLITINMIDLRFVFWITNKCFGYQAMNGPRFPFCIVV